MQMTLHVVYPLGQEVISDRLLVGPSVNDYASGEVENIKVWAEKNLMKLNLSKTKELVII